MIAGELRRAYASVIAARKDGEAALERARAETAALRGLANAGRLVDENPGLLQLRLLQQIGGTTGNTVMIGLPDGATRPVTAAAADARPTNALQTTAGPTTARPTNARTRRTPGQGA
jgi:hypothetical protein